MRVEGNRWVMQLGDCVEVLAETPNSHFDYSVFSPPFASLYTYSNSPADMGNCATDEEFMEHFAFLTPELFRTLKEGRLLSFHCMNLPASKERDGYIGIKDFRGDLIRIFQRAGFIYHSEVCIWKDPLIAATRTHAKGLLHKELCKDSACSRQGIADYVVTMRKPGGNAEPVTHMPAGFQDYIGENEPVGRRSTVDPLENEYGQKVWREYASPVWMDINPSDTLQRESAREHDDERHICPLQLQVIRRCLALWSNPGDLVLSPFAGIGSEGYESVRFGRRFFGIELKRSYFDQAVQNLYNLESQDALPLEQTT